MFYVIIFSTFDVIALVVQAIGGAGASQAEQKGTDTKPSTHIMVPLPPPINYVHCRSLPTLSHPAFHLSPIPLPTSQFHIPFPHPIYANTHPRKPVS